MNGRILIVGSGKIARNAGLFFAGLGYAPSFVSRDPERLAALEAWARRRLRRFAGLGAGPEVATFHLAETDRLPPAQVVLEAVAEQAALKRQALACLPAALLEPALLLSASSSILPSEIHPACAGLHLFYPVELTRFVELVLPAGYAAERRQQLLELVQQGGLEFVEQDERAAFAVNQLLLPLQSECLQALRDGCPSAALDQATVSPLLPMGQLSLMDTVGLDVVLPAVCNYLDRMPAGLSWEILRRWRRGWARWSSSESRAARTAMGCAAARPCRGRSTLAASQRPRASAACSSTAVCTPPTAGCSAGGIDRVLRAAFGATIGFEQALGAEDPVELRSTLESLFIRTGRWYFSPAVSLAEGRA